MQIDEMLYGYENKVQDTIDKLQLTINKMELIAREMHQIAQKYDNNVLLNVTREDSARVDDLVRDMILWSPDVMSTQYWREVLYGRKDGEHK